MEVGRAKEGGRVGTEGSRRGDRGREGGWGWWDGDRRKRGDGKG